MRITPLVALLLSVLAVTPARAVLHITRDHGGYVEEYKAKYKQIRDRRERVAPQRFADDVAARQLGQLPPRRADELARRHDEDVARRKRLKPLHRLAHQALAAKEAQELLRAPRRRQRPEPLAGSPGEDDGLEW